MRQRSLADLAVVSAATPKLHLTSKHHDRTAAFVSMFCGRRLTSFTVLDGRVPSRTDPEICRGCIAAARSWGYR